MFKSVIIGMVILLLLVFFIFLFVIEYIRKKQIHRREKTTMINSFQQELLRTQLEIQEQTLKNISQEIHDNIGQVLSLAKLNLNRMDPSKPNDLEEKIKDSKNLVGKAIQDLRDLSKTLSTDNIESIGLFKAIGYELDMIAKTGSHQTDLNTKGNIIRLDAQKELILFRIVQEVLNNILKHADAGKISVQANYDTRQLELVIDDDGNGFDLKPLNDPDNQATGLGIRNMHNRAKMIGADFSISSTPGEGTRVKLIVPF
jgi:two-component system, NarL family, sensor kinase